MANGPAAAAATESLLDALAPEKMASGAPLAKESQNNKNPPMWLVADPRSPDDSPPGVLNADKLLGPWMDSQGNAVHVMSTDAFDVKLLATLTRPPRHDIHLAIRPVMLGGGWQCGHSLLDSTWTTEEQLHWVAADGRVSVWVRMQEAAGDATSTVNAADYKQSSVPEDTANSREK